MTRRLSLIGAALAWGLAGAACAGSIPLGDIRTLQDWSDLPLLGAGRLVNVGNTRGKDAGRLVDVAPGQAVLLETAGPGCLDRISIYGRTGTLKIWIDGAAAPAIAIPLDQLYGIYPIGQPDKLRTLDADAPQMFPFLAPLSCQAPGYFSASYVPVPFAKSIRVVLEHAPGALGMMYDLFYHRYPDGTAVTSYDPAVLTKREPEIKAAAQAWRRMGERPDVRPTDRVIAGTTNVPAGGSVDLLVQPGSGSVVGLRLRARPWHRAVDRLLVLRAWWDDETQPSVETPIGDLCASHFGFRQSRALPVGGGGADGWYWCYLPMPFAAGALLSVENLSVHSIAGLDYEVVVRPGPTAPEAGRFCARWKRMKKLGDDGRYEMMNVTGAGKLIGYNVAVAGAKTPDAYGRRDSQMQLFRDGESEPGLAGPGLMPYYYGGYYGGPNWDSPLSAVPELEYARHGIYAHYRFFLNDAPDWTERARLVLDASADLKRGQDYWSMVCWYRGRDASAAFAPLTRDDLKLPVSHQPDALEAEELAATADVSGGDLLVVNDEDGRYGVSKDRFISFAPFSYGGTITFRVPIDTEGVREFRMRPVTGPSSGYWGVTVNGAAAVTNGIPVWGHAPDDTGLVWMHPEGWVSLGSFAFKTGENRVTFTSRSPYVGARQRGLLLGLDAIQVAPLPPAR